MTASILADTLDSVVAETRARGETLSGLNLRNAFGKRLTPEKRALFFDGFTNAEIDKLRLDADPKVRVLDLTQDFLNADGTIKTELFTADKIHLSLAGYEVYASRLKPLLDLSLKR